MKKSKLVPLCFVVALIVGFSLTASQIVSAQALPPGRAKQGKIPGKGKHKGWEKSKHKGWSKNKSGENMEEAAKNTQGNKK